MNKDFLNDDNFELINITRSPKHIEIASELRHYLNITNDYKGPAQIFNTTIEHIKEIKQYAFGDLEVEDLVKDKNYFNQIKQERIQKEQDKEKKKQETHERIEDLKNKRKNFCGVGTNKVKRRLNKYIQKDNIAKAYRKALEIEDKNIQAKDNKFPKYKDKIYQQKYHLIHDLIDICKENNYIYGKQNSDVRGIPYIIYFELPGCRQISFHTHIKEEYEIPDYEKEWDGEKNSVFKKLEEAILYQYPEINCDKNNKKDG